MEMWWSVLCFIAVIKRREAGRKGKGGTDSADRPDPFASADERLGARLVRLVFRSCGTTVCHCNLRHACLYHHCIQCRSSASSTPSPAKTDSQRASQPACSCMRRCSSHGTKDHHQKLNDDMRVHRQADIVGAVKCITQTVI